MEIYVEFAGRAMKDRAIAKFEPRVLGSVTVDPRNRMAIWFKPYSDQFANEFIEWLNEQGLEYTNA